MCKKYEKEKDRIKYRMDLEDFLYIPATFKAKIGRHAKTNFHACGIMADTLELRNIRIMPEGTLVADHVWVQLPNIKNREAMVNVLNSKGKVCGVLTFEGTTYRYGEPTGKLSKWRPKYSFKDVKIVKCSMFQRNLKK